jgi:hypothetical protein
MRLDLLGEQSSRPPAEYSHAEVRNMLRALGKPHDLERQPLALLVRHAFGLASCQESVLHLLDVAFADAGERNQLLRDIIFTCDVQRATTQAATRKFNLSRRQFFRYRAEAFAVIAATVERVLQAPPDDAVYLWTLAHQISMTSPEHALSLLDATHADPFGQLGHFRVALAGWAGVPIAERDLNRCSEYVRLRALLHVAEELHGRGEYDRAVTIIDDVRAAAGKPRASTHSGLHFDIADVARWPARRRSDMAGIERCVDEMKRHAGSEWSVTRLRQSEAEVETSRGDIASARSSLDQAWRLSMSGRDAVLLSGSAFAEAQLAFVSGAYERAFRFAFAAAIGLRASRSSSMLAQVIAGKAALASGMAWRPPDDWVQRYPDSWLRADLEAIRARRLLVEGLTGEAHDVARSALVLAERHESPSSIAYCLATLGAVLDRCGDVAGAQRLRVRAWGIAHAIDDAVLHHDVFVVAGQTSRGLGPLIIDDQFGAAVAASAGSGLRALGRDDDQIWFVRAVLEAARNTRGDGPAPSLLFPPGLTDAVRAFATVAPRIATFVEPPRRAEYTNALIAAAADVVRGWKRAGHACTRRSLKRAGTAAARQDAAT